MERRLAAAAQWFAEQLTRHWVGRLDLLFTSEAMNLADLVHLLPHLAKKPSVVYFHDNQLPVVPPAGRVYPNDLVNLSTGMAATELWFNSLYHLKSFAQRATALVEMHVELSSRNPMPDLIGKSRLMPPPLDLLPATPIQRSGGAVERQAHTIFVETREADMELLNAGLRILAEREGPFRLITVGPLKDLSDQFPRVAITEFDDLAQVDGILRADVFLSVRRQANCDLHAIRAIRAGCFPVLPAAGVYREWIPARLQNRLMYALAPDEMSSRIQDAWFLEPPEGADEAFQQAMKPFDATAACKLFDDRFEELVQAGRPLS